MSVRISSIIQQNMLLVSIMLGIFSMVACQASQSEVCGNFICPPGTVCNLEQTQCVLPLQRSTCENKSDGVRCSFQSQPNGVCVDQLCIQGGCGNQILEEGEVCDDGNHDFGDGCSANCMSTEECGNGILDNGESCDDDTPECRDDCSYAQCGDGLIDVQTFEVCDNAAENSNLPDATCRLNCQKRRCGDSVIDSDEVCDDGNSAVGDGCSAQCQSDETCGNGIIDRAKGENCDDESALCTSLCLLATCGDSILTPEANESCDEGSENSTAPDAVCRPDCQPSRCGDGIVDSSEVCDDGNSFFGDGCSGQCQSNETCGNGYVDFSLGESCDEEGAYCRDCSLVRCGDGIVDTLTLEQCDEGNLNSNSPNATCRANCRQQSCGDGIVDPAFGEQCDEQSSDCRNDCTQKVCGDGIVDNDLGEVCDNGSDNSEAPNALCRTDCQPSRCGDSIIDTGETCDDGNGVSGDGCSGFECIEEICSDSDAIQTITESVTLGTTIGSVHDHSPTCASGEYEDVVYQILFPGALDSLEIFFFDKDITWTLHRSSCSATEIHCSRNRSEDLQRDLPAGLYYIIIEAQQTGGESFELKLLGVISTGQSCDPEQILAGIVQCAITTACTDGICQPE